MNRFPIRPGGLLVLLVCGLLCSCRTKPPVVRHFLRMPADYAGGLSSVERARWLKQTRRSGNKSLRSYPSLQPPKDGVLKLASHSSSLGTVINSFEILHAPGFHTASGGLAVVSSSGTPSGRLRLLEYRPGGYTDVSSRFPAANANAVLWWFLDGKERCVTGLVYTRKGPDSVIGSSGSADPRIEFMWNGQAWVQRPPQAHGWRVVISKSPSSR